MAFASPYTLGCGLDYTVGFKNKVTFWFYDITKKSNVLQIITQSFTFLCVK